MKKTIAQTEGCSFKCRAFPIVSLVLSVSAAFAQTKPAFEVATIKPSTPVDQAKEVAAAQSGQAPRRGPHYSPGRAEFTDLRLKDLIGIAYNVKADQIIGPDWLATERFDIVAKMPDSALRTDAPMMLQMLLEERFKLTVHHASGERPVLGLVIAKGGPKLTASSSVPRAIDENAPLKAGEVQTIGPTGVIRVQGTNPTTMNMGENGVASMKVDLESQTRHMEASMVTMAGFAQLLTVDRQGMARGVPQLPIVDMTELKGYYDVVLDVSMADEMNPRPVGVAADPSGVMTSLSTALQAIGLKLEPAKAAVDQLVVDRIEKSPTPN